MAWRLTNFTFLNYELQKHKKWFCFIWKRSKLPANRIHDLQSEFGCRLPLLLYLHFCHPTNITNIYCTDTFLWIISPTQIPSTHFLDDSGTQEISGSSVAFGVSSCAPSGPIKLPSSQPALLNTSSWNFIWLTWFKSLSPRMIRDTDILTSSLLRHPGRPMK